MKTLIKTIWYAIKSRIIPLHYDLNKVYAIISEILRTDTLKVLHIHHKYYIYTYPPDLSREEKYNIYDRAIKLWKQLEIHSSTIFIITTPYSIYYQGKRLKGFYSGVGGNTHFGKFVIVAKYSFLKKEIYPYLEHEILHAEGLLLPDHSNFDEYKHLAKYR